MLEVACGVWHTAAIVAEPEGSSPYSLQHSPLKIESSAPADSLAGTGGGGSFAELAGPPASPAHGPSHNRNNSTSSAFSEVRLNYAVVLVVFWRCGVGCVVFILLCCGGSSPLSPCAPACFYCCCWGHSQAAALTACASLLSLQPPPHILLPGPSPTSLTHLPHLPAWRPAGLHLS